jgi:uncharacterized protein (TIGR03067 family)
MRFVCFLLGPCFLLQVSGAARSEEKVYQLATFSADVTPPLGHPCMGGGVTPAKTIEDALFARGFVLLGAGRPIVLAAVDWCEIRNDAYERWRTVLAKAAGTEKERVLVTCLHQHDAPIADLTAQQLLDKHKAVGRICDPAFHERVVQRVGEALRTSLKTPRKVTHFGIGQGRVEKVASNRRYAGPVGKPHFGRTSATRDAAVRARPEGTIDPWLKTLSFWDGDRPVLALSCYATHPMSYYGQGGVSSDFVGLARKRRQGDDPAVFQIYTSGCSGNVTAGKYNDGAPANRPILADRVYQGMVAAWNATRQTPLRHVAFRSVTLNLEPRAGAGFTAADLRNRLVKDARPFGQCLAALGLSWRQRHDAAIPIDVPMLDLDSAKLLLLPAESYVEFQLQAQRLAPKAFVMVMGYGECAPGYIPTEKAVREDDSNLHDWCWVAPGSEAKMTAVLKQLLGKEAPADQDKLQGTWIVVSAEKDGKIDLRRKGAKVTYKGDTFARQMPKANARGTFKLDPTGKIKAMDITYVEGPEKGETWAGIYSVDGDTLKLCYAAVGRPRPTEFTSKQGQLLILLEREPMKKAR